jgi:hypothetical protein
MGEMNKKALYIDIKVDYMAPLEEFCIFNY